MSTTQTALVERVDLFEEHITLQRPLEEFSLFNPTLDEINASIQRDSQKLLIPEVIQENILTVAEEARVARGLCQLIAIDTDSYTWLNRLQKAARYQPERVHMRSTHLS